MRSWCAKCPSSWAEKGDPGLGLGGHPQWCSQGQDSAPEPETRSAGVELRAHQQLVRRRRADVVSRPLGSARTSPAPTRASASRHVPGVSAAVGGRHSETSSRRPPAMRKGQLWPATIRYPPAARLGQREQVYRKDDEHAEQAGEGEAPGLLRTSGGHPDDESFGVGVDEPEPELLEGIPASAQRARSRAHCGSVQDIKSHRCRLLGKGPVSMALSGDAPRPDHPSRPLPRHPSHGLRRLAARPVGLSSRPG